MKHPYSVVYFGSKSTHIENLAFNFNIEIFHYKNFTELNMSKVNFIPRTFLIELEYFELEYLENQIKTLRNRWPLVDILVTTSNPSARNAIQLMKIGVKDIYISLDDFEVLANVKKTIENQKLLPRTFDPLKSRGRSYQFDKMSSRNPKMWDIFEQASRVSPTQANILILGETGTGKELLARAIHKKSQLPGSFVAVNCSGISEDLIASELFGHTKGAFTGAIANKKGLFTIANNGTIFLDEIGSMPLNAQHHLLRVLQENVIRPVGETEELPVNARVISATSTPLEEYIAVNRFKEDLFYRLDVIRFVIPPLRDRPEDIIYLFAQFSKKFSSTYRINFPTLSDEFIQALLEYHWPGNIRQLENLTERMLLSFPNKLLTKNDFEQMISFHRNNASSNELQIRNTSFKHCQNCSFDVNRPLVDIISDKIELLESSYLSQKLKLNKGKMQKTAEQSGISRRTLLRKIQKYGLNS